MLIEATVKKRHKKKLRLYPRGKVSRRGLFYLFLLTIGITVIILCISNRYSIYNFGIRSDGMDIIIRNTGEPPIYDQITRQVKTLILTGALGEGEALPSMRALARDLRISVITTKRAYEELEREGFITTVPGKGCFVAPRDLELARESALRQVEEYLSQAVNAAKVGGIARSEVLQTLEILYEDE